MTCSVSRSDEGKFLPGWEGGPGRSSVFDPRVADDICEKLMDGMTLSAICRADGMPAESTVRLWAGNPDHPFSARYANARAIGYQKMADELLDISDDGTNDWMERNGKDVENGEAIGRSRLRVDTRKWLLAKALPKLYGDKIIQEQTGTVTINWGKPE